MNLDLVDPFSPAASPLDSLCESRWNRATIDISTGRVRVCWNTTAYQVTTEDLKELGHNAIVNNKYLVERRREMFLGIRHKDCGRCWKAEDSGQPSERLGAQIVWDRHQASPVRTPLRQAPTLEDPVLQSRAISILEIQLGNLCELKCLYCCPGNSTKWAQELYQAGDICRAEYDRFFQAAPAGFQEAFWEWFARVAGSLRAVSFVGGEPTLHADFPAMLRKVDRLLRDAGNTQCFVRVITNLNCGPKAMLHLADAFASLDPRRPGIIDVSMEAFGRRAELIRYGLKWERFANNFRALLERRLTGVQISIHPTINALSISSFAELVTFFAPLREEFNVPLPFHENTVIQPTWLALEVLTPDFREYLAETSRLLVKYDLESQYSGPKSKWGYHWRRFSLYVDKLAATITQEPNSADPSIRRLRSRFAHEIQTLRGRRDFPFLETFPEMAEFYKLCSTPN